MQEYKDNKIVKAEEGQLNVLMDKGARDLEKEVADSIRIAVVSVGDEFEIKGLKFKITKKHNRGRITAKLVGMK